MRLGDLNFESSDLALNDYSNVYNLFSLVKEPTCFKNPYNPSCIDIFLKKRPPNFQNTLTIETGIWDFHKMVITVMKVFYKKQKPKIIQLGATKTMIIRYFREN